MGPATTHRMPRDDGRRKKSWLGEEDSNPRYQGQNLASYP
jgi:hypothetical protein